MHEAKIDYSVSHFLFLKKKRKEEVEEIYTERNAHTQRKLCGYQLIDKHKQPLHN